MGVTYGGYEAVDPKLLLEECYAKNLPPDVWRGRANAFVCASGRKPGYGGVLLLKSDIDQLDLTVSNTLTFADGQTTKNLQKITLTRYQCVLPGAESDGNAVYLCEVFDRRMFVARIPIDTAYNLRDSSTGSYINSTLNSGTPWTWTQLVEDLWDTITTGVLGTYPGLPFTPNGTPESWNFFGGNAWNALNDVVERVGCVVTYDPEADAFGIVQLGTDTSTATDATNRLALRDRTWEDYGFDPNRGWRPEKIRVLFRVVPSVAEGVSPWEIRDITLATADGVEPGTFVTLYDDLAYDGTNGTDLDSRAAERAEDWLRVSNEYVTSFVQSVIGVFGDLPKTIGPAVAGWALRDLGPSGLQCEVGGSAVNPIEAFKLPPIGSGGGSGDSKVIAYIHVVQHWDSGSSSFTGDPYFETVEFVGNVWPPVLTDPLMTYGGPDDDTTIFESENRDFRLIDKVGDVIGPVTHIIPAFLSPDGSVFVVFWATNTYQDFDLVEPDTTMWTVTCVDGTTTIVPVSVTKRFAITVTPPGTATTGLTLTITDPP